MSHFGEAFGSSLEALVLCLVWSASRGKMMKQDCLGRHLSLAGQSVIVFVCLFICLPEGLHSWAKTHEIDIGEVIYNSSCRKRIVKGVDVSPRKPG